MAFISIYVIWGTTYLAIIIGLEGLPPFMMASVRFLVAAIILLGYSIAKGEPTPTYQALFKNAVLSVFVLVGGQGLLIWSEQYIASGYASILVATIPIWLVVMDKANWKYYFSNPFIIIGVVIGFIGIVILFGDTMDDSFLDPTKSKNQIVAASLVLVGAWSWVAGTLFNRSRPARGSIYSNLGWQLVFGGIISLGISGTLGEFPKTNFSEVSLSAWISILYLSVAGSIIAFVVYTWLLTQKSSAAVGTYAYINPVIAVLIGWWYANEEITIYQIIGMIIIVVSAITINLKRGQILKSK